METKVYGIDTNKIELTWDLWSMSNNDFMTLAEEQGNVWSLGGFESAFNSEEINDENFFIRII